ncbi:MAG: helix-turn-helix domain-containing protein [Dehalococcoidia bacterium]|nr:helix-turn-helix domain-containing protein [Dehalococcoidia bacterium]
MTQPEIIKTVFTETDETAETMNWVSIPEAIKLLKTSRATLYRKIESGEIISRKEHGTRTIGVPLSHKSASETAETATETTERPQNSHETPPETYPTELINSMNDQINQLKQHITTLEQELERKSQAEARQQTIIMSMSQNQQLLLQNSRQSWWQKMFGLDKQSEETTTG